MTVRLVTLAVLGAAGLGLAAMLSAQTGERTLRDGVFSAAQAERGARVFASICTDCHELAEFTAAGAYLEEVEGESLWETFDFVSTKMPDDDPGSLRLDEYAAVLRKLRRKGEASKLESRAKPIRLQMATLKAQN